MSWHLKYSLLVSVRDLKNVACLSSLLYTVQQRDLLVISVSL